MASEVKDKTEDRQRLVRAVVRREPEAIFQADEDCMIYCWTPDKKMDGEVNPPCAVSDFWDPHDTWSGVELPEGSVPIPIFVAEGKVLYGISKGESHLMMSIVPLRFNYLFGGGSK